MPPMEIGSTDQPVSSIVPSWVVVDQDIYRKALASFRPGHLTSAKTRASNGEVVRVSFTVRPLPCASRLCVHFPKSRRKLCGFDTVVAAHGKAVLFRLRIDFKGLPSSCSAIDHFIVWASPGGSRISLLPRWYSTEDEIEAAEVGSWRRNPYMALGRSGTGLFISDREDFVVAELHLDVDRLEDVDAPLEAQLFRLCSSRERSSCRSAAVSSQMYQPLMAPIRVWASCAEDAPLNSAAAASSLCRDASCTPSSVSSSASIRSCAAEAGS